MRDRVFIPCPLCGSKDETEVYRDAKNRVVMCSECTLVYLNPRLTDAGYRAYYDEEYQRARHGVETYEAAVERLSRKGTYARKKARYLETYRSYLTPASRVLEIGSSWGAMLAMLRDEIGCEVEGVEISALAAEVSERYYRVPAAHKTFEEYAGDKREHLFDFVILHHVLEHAASPLAMLQSMHTVLAPLGRLALALPNMALPEEPLNRYFRIEHCSYFTPLTLVEAFRRTGWKMTDIEEAPGEMRVLAARTGDQVPAVSFSDFGARYGADRIQKVIARQDVKYRALRTLKHVARVVLPQRLLGAVRKGAVSFLKYIHIIDV